MSEESGAVLGEPDGAREPAADDLPPTQPLGVPSQADLTTLFDRLERAILGEPRTLTRIDVAREAGVPQERTETLWRALGFTAPATDEDVMFVQSDVDALRLLDDLVNAGLVDAHSEEALARSAGRAFSRLAEYEIGEVATTAFNGFTDADPEMLEAVVAQTLPLVEQLQSYVWRRHLANAAGRLLLQPLSTDETVPMGVGFADIVGFTRRSRRITTEELGQLVETFESTVNSVITSHGGRIIKTIGDEVLFAADDPVTTGNIALDLAAGAQLHEHFPDVRVGVAYGDVLPRLGDVFGEVVNIASRLTSLAKPGRVLMNAELAEHLRDNPAFKVKRWRTVSVKGYNRLETWSLREPPEPPYEPDAQESGTDGGPGRHADRARRDARRQRREEIREELLHAPGEMLEQIADRLSIPELPLRRGRDDAEE